MEVLLTGATGFIGTPLVAILIEHKFGIVATVRSRTDSLSDSVKQVVVDNILPDTNWRVSLDSVDVVIHLAARVHIMNDKVADSLAEFRRVNTAATLNLARQAAENGVKRFIYLSSIKVNGEFTLSGFPFTTDDNFVPTDAYGLSKYEAEQGLLQLARETSMEVVIIRPPLVYGPGVKANFRSLMKWLSKGIPLPLGLIRNKRSLVALDNLVDLVITCIDHPGAANQIFLVSDGDDLSTTELLQRVGKALGKPARLIPVPARLIDFVATLIGKRDVSQRLLGSLQVDISKTQDLLGWVPPVSVDEALQKTAQSFLLKK